MNNILYKELKLCTSPLTYFFICFSFMFFVPGYPILCGVFFVTLGIFKSFENMVETNDIIFSALLPIAKKDVVKGKYILVCFIELCSICILSLTVIIRNTIFLNSSIYRNNALMNSNCFALGVAFIIFSMFNLIFVNGFFNTTYKRTKPFVIYIIVTFIIIAISEALHYFPNLYYLNAFGKEYIYIQLLLLIMGIIIYLLLTCIAYRKSCIRFEKIDL